MKITLHLHDGRAVAARLPHPTCTWVEVGGLECECSRGLALRVVGGRETADERRSEAAAYCARCKGNVGRLVVTYDTVFGIDEDRRVMFGRPRVY